MQCDHHLSPPQEFPIHRLYPILSKISKFFSIYLGLTNLHGFELLLDLGKTMVFFNDLQIIHVALGCNDLVVTHAFLEPVHLIVIDEHLQVRGADDLAGVPDVVLTNDCLKQ